LNRDFVIVDDRPMDLNLDSPARIPGIAVQLAQCRAVIECHLGDTVLAIHLFGSALQGGLKPSSDIDLLVTVTDAPGEAVRRALMRDLLHASAPPGPSPALRPLEVTVLAHACVSPWRYPARRELQFGEWLRSDLEAGRFEEPAIDHDIAILLRQVRQHGVSIVGPPPSEVFDPVPDCDISNALQATIRQWNVPEDWAGEETNIVLALARVWYTAVTGAIASKDAAADWLIQRMPEPHRALLSRAKAAYLGEADDDLARRPAAVAAFILQARQAIERVLEGRGDP
jgi:streptomycin 3"-adenylyltransferase